MTEEEIRKAVLDHKCHGAYFCTVATTGYPEEKRIWMCTECWNEIFGKISEKSLDSSDSRQ